MCVIVISDWLHSLWLHNWIHLSLKRETQFWHLPRHVTAFFDRRWFVVFWIRCEEVPYSHPMSNSRTKFTKGNVCLHVNLEFVNEFNSQASSSIFPQSFWNVWVWRIAVTEQLNLLKNCSYYWIYWTIEQLNLLKPPVLWTCCWFQLCADTLWFGRSVCFLRFDMIKIIVRPLLALAISIAPDVSLQSPTRSDLSFWKERQRAGDSQTAQMSSANTFGSMAHLTERNWEWNW
jgi:hypothetical protein